MAENDMVEKAARAICASDFDGDEKVFDTMSDEMQRNFRINARAAIKATPLERYEELLRRIKGWAEAYPLDVFPEPDLKRARELLDAGGIELGSVAASNMRHVLSGIQAMIDSALNRPEVK